MDPPHMENPTPQSKFAELDWRGVQDTGSGSTRPETQPTWLAGMEDAGRGREEHPVLPRPTTKISAAQLESFLFCSSMPERFPEFRVIPFEWGAKMTGKLSELDAVLEPQPADCAADVTQVLPGCRATTLLEEIDVHIAAEMKDFELKLDPEVRDKINYLRNNYREERKLNRLPVRVTWLPLDPRSNAWSERNIIKQRRADTVLQSYALCHDFHNSKFRRMFISQNYAGNPHIVKKRLLELEAQQSVGSAAKSRTPVADDEVIVTVSYYQPVRGIKTAEFDILGSQTLADLRDAFYCDEDVNPTGGSKYTGACFFISGRFFVDTRDPTACDYSHWIGDYLARRAPEKLQHRTGIPMDSAKIGSIPISLNCKCAFLHQGDCEHRVTFTALRRFDRSRDCPHREGYPIRTFEPATKMTMCAACGVNQAQALIFNSSLLPANPSYLCRVCADALLYDEKGEKIEGDEFLQFDYEDVV